MTAICGVDKQAKMPRLEPVAKLTLQMDPEIGSDLGRGC